MREETIIIDGMVISYKIVGQGPTILILHGWGRGSDSYSQVMESIAKEGYSVVVPDLPGFGKSEPPKEAWGVDKYAQFAFQFSQKLSLTKFYLLGHSFGGQVAFKFAIEHPDRLAGLILCAAAVVRRKPDFKKRMIHFVSNMGSMVFSFWPFSMFSTIAGRAFYRILGSGDWRYSKGIMKYVRQKVVRQDLSALTSHVTVPTLIVWGDQDKATPIQDAYTLKDAIPRSSLKVIPGIGHRVHQEAPDIFIESVVQFLRAHTL